MSIEDEESISPIHEKQLLKIVYLTHKIVSRKLGRRYQSSVEDIKQRVFLKLWRWKKTNADKTLSAEEWQKFAHTVAVNEVIDFFRKKDNSHIPFSQMKAELEREVLITESPDVVAGNSAPEVYSMLALVWEAAQQLTLRQKYAYFFQFHDFVVDFIASGCCSIEKLAGFFEIERKELLNIIKQLPLSDEQLGEILEKKLADKSNSNGDRNKITAKQIWEARSKAKAKLARALRAYFINERLFEQRRPRVIK